MIGALFAMDAWNNVGFAAGELKDPKRDLAFAMVTAFAWSSCCTCSQTLLT